MSTWRILRRNLRNIYSNYSTRSPSIQLNRASRFRRSMNRWIKRTSVSSRMRCRWGITHVIFSTRRTISRRSPKCSGTSTKNIPLYHHKHSRSRSTWMPPFRQKSLMFNHSLLNFSTSSIICSWLPRTWKLSKEKFWCTNFWTTSETRRWRGAWKRLAISIKLQFTSSAWKTPRRMWNNNPNS